MVNKLFCGVSVVDAKEYTPVPGVYSNGMQLYAAIK